MNTENSTAGLNTSARDTLRVGGFLCLVEAILIPIVVPFY